MKVLCIRHAESTGNVTGETSKNPELTPFGILQSSRLCGHFDIAIVSPLIRAKQTLQYSGITYDSIQEWDIAREYKIEHSDFMDGENIVFETPDELSRRGDLII